MSENNSNIVIPDVHTAAENAIMIGEGAKVGQIAVGRDITQTHIHYEPSGINITGGNVNVQGDMVGGDKIVGEGDIAGRDIHQTFISYDTAFQKVADSTAFVLDQLQTIYGETRQQSQGWFRLSLIAAGIGFTLIGVGVIAVFIGQLTAGIVTAISSIIPNAAAALFFVQSKTANDRVDAIQRRLTDARELQTAVDITNTISDEKSRDKLKSEIVRKALRIDDNPNAKANN